VVIGDRYGNLQVSLKVVYQGSLTDHQIFLDFYDTSLRVAKSYGGNAPFRETISSNPNLRLFHFVPVFGHQVHQLRSTNVVVSVFLLIGNYTKGITDDALLVLCVIYRVVYREN